VASDTALNAVQLAMVTRLRADGVLTGRLGGSAQGVTDYVDPKAPYPYLVVGDADEVPDNAFAQEKREVDVTLHIWDQSRGWKLGTQIVSDVMRLLDYPAQLTVVGWPASGPNTAITRWRGTQRLRDPDGITRHHSVQFRVYVEQ